MSEQLVLFIGSRGSLFDELSGCIDDEGLGGLAHVSTPSGISRNRLVDAEAVIIGPDITGRGCVQLCREIRSLSGASITVISSELNEVEELRLVASGATFVSFQPIRPRAIAARLAAQITRHAPEGSGDAVSYHGLEAFPDEHRVTFSGEPLELTKTEFELLILFMRHPRQVHTHDSLSRWLWDDNSDVDHHRLEAHVSRLRKKVAQAGGPAIISSIRGVGYRLMTADQLAETVTPYSREPRDA